MLRLIFVCSLRVPHRHVCSRLQGAAPLPAWLPGSALHCFSWLAPQAAVADPDITTTSTASAVAADTGCANNQGVAALTHEEDRGASGTNTAGVEHMEADSPTTKRKLALDRNTELHTSCCIDLCMHHAHAGADCMFIQLLVSHQCQPPVLCCSLQPLCC